MVWFECLVVRCSVGVIIAVESDPADHEPFQVRSNASGDTWWYREGQIFRTVSRASLTSQEESVPHSDPTHAAMTQGTAKK